MSMFYAPDWRDRPQPKGLEELLEPFSKESDLPIHDKMLTLIDLYDSDPSTYDKVMQTTWNMYKHDYQLTPEFGVVSRCYKLAREL